MIYLSYVNSIVLYDTPIYTSLLSSILRVAGVTKIAETRFVKGDLHQKIWKKEEFSTDALLTGSITLADFGIVHSYNQKFEKENLAVGKNTATTIANRIEYLTDIYEWIIVKVGFDESHSCLVIATRNPTIHSTLLQNFSFEESYQPNWKRIYGGVQSPVFSRCKLDKGKFLEATSAILFYRDSEIHWEGVWNNLKNFSTFNKCYAFADLNSNFDSIEQWSSKHDGGTLDFGIYEVDGSQIFCKIASSNQNPIYGGYILPATLEDAKEIVTHAVDRSHWYDKISTPSLSWMAIIGKTPPNSILVSTSTPNTTSAIVDQWNGDIGIMY